VIDIETGDRINQQEQVSLVLEIIRGERSEKGGMPLINLLVGEISQLKVSERSGH
jgi:hypothetical protein